MDKTISGYQDCIKQLLTAYQQETPEGVKTELIFDDQRLHYLAVRVGWFKQKSVYLCLVHLDVCDDMIVIQANNTEDPIDEALIELGVPREKICLGVLPPEVRDEAYQHRQNNRVSVNQVFSNNTASAQVSQNIELQITN
jgi:hypothetical protein